MWTSPCLRSTWSHRRATSSETQSACRYASMITVASLWPCRPIALAAVNSLVTSSSVKYSRLRITEFGTRVGGVFPVLDLARRLLCCRNCTMLFVMFLAPSGSIRISELPSSERNDVTSARAFLRPRSVFGDAFATRRHTPSQSAQHRQEVRPTKGARSGSAH